MSKIDCDHVLYCCFCDRYHCSDCGCPCRRPVVGEETKATRRIIEYLRASPEKVPELEAKGFHACTATTYADGQISVLLVREVGP